MTRAFRRALLVTLAALLLVGAGPDFDGTAATVGVGRELFGVFRRQSSSAEEGASFFFEAMQ